MTRPLGLFVLILVAGLSLAGMGEVLARWHAEQGNAAPAGIAHAHYAFDPGDDRALAAYATDVFVGRILGQVGAIGAPTSAPGQEMPQTQYTVEVMESIKGDAAGVVTVNQVGGVDAQSRQPMALAGDAPLRPGSSELFLVVHVQERGWYQVVAGGHGHLAADEPAQREALAARFGRALGGADEDAAPENRASSVSGSQDDPAAIDFIVFNGAVYLSAVYLAEDSPATPYTPVGVQDLGPVVGKVVTNWVDSDDAFAYPNEPCSWSSLDGTAPRLSPGDPIYAVRGYATTFRLAARRGDGVVSYQAWCNDEAEVGADLFDVYDRVDRISVTEDLSESSGWATIEDPATVSGLVGMLLEGAVIPEELTSTAPITHQMVIHLDDGTTFRASAAPGEFLWGLGAVAVPAEFTETLHGAWETHLDAERSATLAANAG